MSRGFCEEFMKNMLGFQNRQLVNSLLTMKRRAGWHDNGCILEARSQHLHVFGLLMSNFLLEPVAASVNKKRPLEKKTSA